MAHNKRGKTQEQRENKPKERTANAQRLDSIFWNGRDPTDEELKEYRRYAGTVPVDTLVNTMGSAWLSLADANAYVAYFKRVHPD